jgi:hypothetical protein
VRRFTYDEHDIQKVNQNTEDLDTGNSFLSQAWIL